MTHQNCISTKVIPLAPRKLVMLEGKSAISLEEIDKARERISGTVVRTPIVRLDYDDTPCQIFLKLECLQPTGSFKVRGAGNAISLIPKEKRSLGVYTCSAGNMAQALSWHAKRENIPCTVIVPDTAPETKVAAIQRLGSKIIKLSWDEVWQVAESHSYGPLSNSTFIHPFVDPKMIAGNGTTGLEILEQVPDVDSIIVPFGGGGLFTGIASAVKAKNGNVKMFAAEVETAAPLKASLDAGSPREIVRKLSFVDGIGTKNVLPEIWSLATPLLDGSIVVSLREIASAIKLLVERNRIVAEGAGASSLAAALSGKITSRRLVAVISGGNIDTSKLVTILQGGVP